MSKYQLKPATVSQYVEKIMLQTLFDYHLFKAYFQQHQWDDDIANSLGLPSEMEDEDNSHELVEKLLKPRYKMLKNKAIITDKRWQQAVENLQQLADILQLNQAEVAILHFALQIKLGSALKNIFNRLKCPNFLQAYEIMGNLFGFPTSEILSVLKKNSKLMQYGLLDERRGYASDLDDYVVWGDVLDANEFMIFPLDEKALLNKSVVVAEPPKLALTQFEHVKPSYQMMLDYLQQAVENQQKGVNILIYGVAGTGKTELAGLLAQQLNLTAYNLAYMDSDGDVIRAETRLNHCRMAQTLLARQSQNLLIFDEIEDVFASSFFDRSIAQKNKAWLNQLLENNAVPMIWVGNSVNGIDEAFLRRFDLILEMPDLPAKNKAELIRTLAAGKLSEGYIQHFAQVRSLTPAILSRAISVASRVNLREQTFSSVLLSLLNQTLKSQNKPQIQPLVESKLSYDLDWVSCGADIYQITDGLKRTQKGRICCYGPPGTGKTAWASWLAEQLDMPLLVQQGSDLLSPFVGGTERNIAAAFEQAKSDKLVLDEVDSFLFSREGAQRSWERSQVNEMLTQIERFDGLLMVSTNLMEVLDPAALRRFDLKLKFDYLSAEQRKNFAQHQAETLSLGKLNEGDLHFIERLNLLTPGDFAAVARRHQFSPFAEVKTWLNALQEECQVKPQFNSARRIGF